MQVMEEVVREGLAEGGRPGSHLALGIPEPLVPGQKIFNVVATLHFPKVNAVQ